MGLFDRIRHPVSGTATVTAATEPTGMRSPQEVRMTLTVSGLGYDPFTIEHAEKCHTDRWPKVGTSLPVVFDSERRERLEVQWDDVRPGEAPAQAAPAAAQPAQAQPAPATGIPPEAQGVVDQLTQAFGGAQVTRNVQVVSMSGAPEAAKEAIRSVESMTGMDLDGDGRIGGPAGSLAPPPGAQPAQDTVSRLERLAALHKQGALTDDEFAQQKKRLLDTL
jgi:Short C-terminal domain